MRLTVLRNRFVPGWPEHSDGERGYVLDAADALERNYSTDAHCTAYESSCRRRLNSEAIGRVPVAMVAAVFDVDCEAVHGTHTPVPASWRAESRGQTLALFERHPGGFFYETRGGFRLLYALPEPFELAGPADVDAWKQAHALACAHFGREFGIICDSACSDWTRIYRLPHATRDPGGKPENLPSMGDSAQIGTISLRVSLSDVVVAHARSKSFGGRKDSNVTPIRCDGNGLFFTLLDASGSILRDRGNGSMDIVCPNEAQHTSGRRGDGSSVLYLPSVGRDLGAIHCLHAHCAGFRAREWLGMFSRDELDAARARAGFLRVA